MPLITLPAHFDGDKICLDEPYALRPNVKLMVVVLAEPKFTARRTQLQEAAKFMAVEYAEDQELTCFTSTDGDDFYE